MILVSIIMPLFNNEKYVSETIESVLNQTFNDFELIIIDDCSRDNSREIVRKYREKDNRIKLISHNKNTGIAKTTNDGLDIANGKFIAFIDSDDVWDQRKLEKQLKVLENNENYIVWSEGEVIDENSEPTGQTFTQIHNAITKKKSGNIFNELLQGNYLFKSSLILKKKNIGNRRFNERLRILDDYLFELALATKYNYFFINEPLTKYRIHGTNITCDQKSIGTDLFKLRTIIIKNYDKYIPKSIKWDLILGIINQYFKNGEKRKSRSYIYKLAKVYPLSPLIFWYMVKSLINSNFILRFFYLFLKFYQNCIQRFYTLQNNAKLSLWFKEIN